MGTKGFEISLLISRHFSIYDRCLISTIIVYDVRHMASALNHIKHIRPESTVKAVH